MACFTIGPAGWFRNRTRVRSVRTTPALPGGRARITVARAVGPGEQGGDDRAAGLQALGHTGDMSSSLTTIGIALANVACSVSLVLVNKAVFSLGFNFPMSLTCLHFAFTVAFYRVLAGCGFFEMRPIPQTEAFKIAGFGVGSIGFMNISLHLNSVGFYQITKLAVVPCTLFAQVRARRLPRALPRSFASHASIR